MKLNTYTPYSKHKSNYIRPKKAKQAKVSILVLLCFCLLFISLSLNVLAQRETLITTSISTSLSNNILMLSNTGQPSSYNASDMPFKVSAIDLSQTDLLHEELTDPDLLKAQALLNKAVKKVTSQLN